MDEEQLKKLKDLTLTVDQVCDVIGVSRVTLWKWEKQGKLIPVRLGKFVKYRKEDIEQILKDGIKWEEY